jgi:protein O-mannosyl-transferase
VTMFCLLMFCSDLFLDGWRRYVLTTVFFVGAALSKEMALTMPLLMVLLYVVYSGTGWMSTFEGVKIILKRYAWLYFWMVFAGFFCIYLRYISFGKLMQSGGLDGDVGILPRISYVGQTIIFYTRMLFWPFSDLGPQHPFHLEKMSLVAEWCGILVVGLVVLYCIHALRQRKQGQLLILALMTSFFPVLNILPLKIGVNIGHERFMALPLVLASIVIVRFLAWMFSAKQPLRMCIPVILGGWLFIAALNVYVTVPLWHNDVALWSWAYAKAPLEPYTQLSLIGALYRDRNIGGAERIINDSIAGGADSRQFDVIRAAILVEKGEFEHAVKLLNSVLNRRGRPDEVLTNAGVDIKEVQINVDKSPEAASYAFSYITLARAYIGLYDFKNAEHAARLANFYNADYPIGKLMLALSLYGQNEWGLGERQFNEARRAFHPAAQRDLEITRSYFFEKICSRPKSMEVVCAAYKKDL